MHKIPSLFRRDPADRRRFTHDHAVQLPTDAVPTPKFDGVAVELDPEGRWWVRHELRPGAPWPESFRHAQHDPVTKKDVGWVRVDYPAAAPERDEGDELAWLLWNFAATDEALRPGSFEAVGPSFCGNPHNYGVDTLIRHGQPTLDPYNLPTDYDGLRSYLVNMPYEGVVWWTKDGPVAKVRRHDLNLPWPATRANAA